MAGKTKIEFDPSDGNGEELWDSKGYHRVVVGDKVCYIDHDDEQFARLIVAAFNAAEALPKVEAERDEWRETAVQFVNTVKEDGYEPELLKPVLMTFSYLINKSTPVEQ